VLRESGLGLGT